MNMTFSISPYQKSQLTSSEVALPGWLVLDESADTILSPPSGKSIINSYNEWSPFKQGWLRPKHNKKGLEMANTEKIKGKASKPFSKHVWLVIGISSLKSKYQFFRFVENKSQWLWWTENTDDLLGSIGRLNIISGCDKSETNWAWQFQKRVTWETWHSNITLFVCELYTDE